MCVHVHAWVHASCVVVYGESRVFECVCVCVCVCEVDVDGYRSFCFADDWCFFFTLMMVVYCAVKCELITCTCVLAMGLVGTKRVIFFFFFSVHLPSIVVNTWVSLAKTK